MEPALSRLPQFVFSPEPPRRRHVGSARTLPSHVRYEPRKPPYGHLLLLLARPAVWLPGATLDSAKRFLTS